MNENDERSAEWYHKSWFIWFMVLSFGFFAIPLVVRNPYLKPYQKWIISIFSVVFTVLVVAFTIWAILLFLKVWRELQLGLSWSDSVPFS